MAAISIQKREPLSIPVQAGATILAIAAAVALPQFFHWLGKVSGAGTAPGIAFSPVKAPLFAKTLAAMIFGRVLRTLACAAAFYGFGLQKIAPLGIWKSVPQCLPGIVLQLVLIPLIVYRVENAGKRGTK